MPELAGVIFDIDHFAVHDGPGIRSVVYFKGCPLRCVWCHSPESQRMEPQPLYIKSKCLFCPSCAGEQCPNGARQVCGRMVTIDELMEELLPNRVFFESSGGGVTLSGGEVLSQPRFAAALLERLRGEGIHTVVETSAMGSPDDLMGISALADLLYCDVKAMDPEKHKEYTGAGNETVLSNIELLADNRGRRGIVLRIPLIPGYTDSVDNISKIYSYALAIGVTEIHLLPYNPSAPAKYEWLSRSYTPGLPERQSASYLDDLKNTAPSGINVTIM